MYTGTCHTGNLGSLGGFDGLDGIGLIFNLLFLVGSFAGLALLAYYAIRRARVPAGAAEGRSSAKETLQAQYARGEITSEQFEQRKKELRLPD